MTRTDKIIATVIITLLFGLVFKTLASVSLFQGEIDITNYVEYVEFSSYRIDGKFTDLSVAGFDGEDVSTNDLIFTENILGDVDAWSITNIISQDSLSISVNVEYTQGATSRVGVVSGVGAICTLSTNHVGYPQSPSLTGARISENMKNEIRNYGYRLIDTYTTAQIDSKVTAMGTQKVDLVTFNSTNTGFQAQFDVVATSKVGIAEYLSTNSWAQGEIERLNTQKVDVVTFNSTNTGLQNDVDTRVLRAGDTVSGAIYSTATSALTSPLAAEIPTAGWVRSLAIFGEILYATTNVAGNPDFYAFGSVTQAVGACRDYGIVTNGQHVGTIISTSRYSKINGQASVNAYLARSSSPADSLKVYPTLSYSYDGTNLLGHYESESREISAGTNLYTWIVPFPTIVATNDTGVFIVRGFHVDEAVSSPTLEFCLGGGSDSRVTIAVGLTEADFGVRGSTNIIAGSSNYYNEATRTLTFNTNAAGGSADASGWSGYPATQAVEFATFGLNGIGVPEAFVDSANAYPIHNGGNRVSLMGYPDTAIHNEQWEYVHYEAAQWSRMAISNDAGVDYGRTNRMFVFDPMNRKTQKDSVFIGNGIQGDMISVGIGVLPDQGIYGGTTNTALAIRGDVAIAGNIAVLGMKLDTGMKSSLPMLGNDITTVGTLTTTNLTIKGTGPTNGAVWTATGTDGAGEWIPPIMFRAYRVADFSFTGLTERVVSWDSIGANYGNAFDGTIFVTPVKGIYEFYVHYSIDQSGGICMTRGKIQISGENASYHYGNSIDGIDYAFHSFGSGKVYLTTNITVMALIRASGSVTNKLPGVGTTSFSGMLHQHIPD